jgi:Zn-dependent protease
MRSFLSKSVRLGRVAGVEVRIHAIFFLAMAAALLALRQQPAAVWWWAAAFVAALAGSVLVHELAHCLAARRRGGSPHQVVLWPLGGLVQVSAPRTAGNEIAVALAGPVSNFLLAAAGGVVLYSRGMPATDEAPASRWGIELFTPPMDAEGLTLLGVVRICTWVNLYLAAVNLLPAAPLDGSRLVRGLLWRVVGYRRAVRYTQGLTLAAATAVCLTPVLLRARGVPVDLLVELSLALLGVFLFLAAQSESRRSPPREDDEAQEAADEWRVGTPELLLAGDESPGAPAMIGQAVEARLEEKLHRQQQQEAEEDRRMDEILLRLHVAGPQALSPEDQALLKRVSARYRGRKSK